MIYLYVKTHNITGLKYFGKTTVKSRIYSYKGSGKYWKRHLKVHGNDISTEIIGCYENIEECQKVALEFSKINDIVNSDEWANLKEENGIDGGWEKGKKHSESHRKAMKRGMLGNINGRANFGKKNPNISEKLKGRTSTFKGLHHSEKVKKQIAEKMVGNNNAANRIISEETRKKLSEKARSRKPISEETRKKMSESAKNRRVINGS